MAQEIVGVQLQVDGAQAVRTVAEWREDLRKAEQSASQVAKAFGDGSKQAEIARSRVQSMKEELGKAVDNAAKFGESVGKTDAPLKSMRTQLREALQELIQMQTEFGDISPEAQAAAQNVADLRDRIKDANEVASLFDPEKKFQSVIGVGQGIASGFAAAQGSMALFGVQSKEVEASLLKVQAAMALSQGLNGVVASIEDFKRLGAVISQIGIFQKINAVSTNVATVAMRLFGVATTGTGVAFNFLKGAIIATGIGAIAVILGTLISKIMDWTSSTNTQEAAQKKLNAALERQDELLKQSLSDIDYAQKLAVARAKTAGKSGEDVFNINQFYRQKEIDALKKDWEEKFAISVAAQAKSNKLTDEDRKKAADEVKKARDAYNAKVRESDVEANEQAATRAEAQRQKEKEATDKSEQLSKQASDKAKAAYLTDLKKKEELEKQFQDKAFEATHTAEETELRQSGLRFAALLAMYEKHGWDTTAITADYLQEEQAIVDKHAKEKADKQAAALHDEIAAAAQEDQEKAKITEQRIADQKALVDSIVSNDKLSFDVRKQLLADFYQSALDAAITNGQSQVEIDRQFTEAKKALAKEEAETKIRAAQSVSTALGEFATLAGEQTAAGKAFAVTAATIQAILGAQQAFTALSGIPIVGPVLGGLAAAGALAAGYVNVKKILAVQVPGKGSGGSAPGLSGGSAPISPQAGASQAVKLDQQSINSMGNATVKAYVVESDNRAATDRINRIQNAAKFK